MLPAHERWLRTVVYARLGEPQAVDEVMQNVALDAVQQRAPLHDPSKVGPWLYRLAVMHALQYRRKQGRRRKLTDRYAQRLQTTGTTAAPDPLSWLLADERRKLVRVALGRIPHRDAEMMLLKYTEDWSYRQLATHLGISESAVETRLFRARQRLRQELQELEVIEANP